MKRISTIIAIVLLSFSISSAQVTRADILNEDFEGGTFPDFWSYQDVTGGGGWNYQTGGLSGGAYPSTAHSGTYNACFRGFPNPSVQKLVTPAMDLSNGGTLNFWWAAHTVNGIGNIDLLTVLYKEGANGNWIQLDTYPEGADVWTEATFNIPTTSNEVYVAFEGSYDGGAGVCVDDVRVFNSSTDMGILKVTPILAYGTESTPTVTVKNFGLITANSYSVTVTIVGTAYNETLNITTPLDVSQTIDLQFPTWTLPAEGMYNINATLNITDDANLTNNTFTAICSVDQTPTGSLLSYFDTNSSIQTAFPQTDGQYIYVGTWSQNKYERFSMQGTPAGAMFTIGDIWGDDLAYDGQYFYSGKWNGSDDSSVVYQLDLANETLVSTFKTPVTVGSLEYSYSSGNFIGNLYGNVFQEFNHAGEYQSQFLGSNYTSGTAIDRFSDPENPKIWFYEMGAAGIAVQLIEYDLNTTTATGRTIPIDAAAFPEVVYGNGEDKDLAGGLACYVNDENQVVLLVGTQQIYQNYTGRILTVYLDEAARSYETIITVLDDNNIPVEGASVTLGATRNTTLTNQNGEAIFSLIDNYYDFAINKPCFLNSYGSFQVDGGSPIVNDVALSSVAAPLFTNGVVATNGTNIELTFNNGMNINGQTSPAGFSVLADGNDIAVVDVQVSAGNNNVIILSTLETITSNQVVTVSYSISTGTTQSDCNVFLEAVIEEDLANNSSITVSIDNLENSLFEIFPNPSNGIFTIKASQGNTINDISITDITSKLVFKGDKNTQINISDQAKGIYFLKVQTSQGSYLTRIILK